ncbi:ATP-binding protein [Actinomadura sp. 7K534]|uniref:AAA family ATPase n=1 Tax=Actinomadura sp. 7K534 TaxID=2530366 RepID=UPI001049D26F|nr:ATP-binding protein [Actinomadura sp. 7K534]TDB92827.1 ATP-binding protein [Actinomadura sp. 7K534]
MLLSFRVANHRSLRHEQQLLLTPSYAADAPADAPWEALPVAGIFGANASGKSNVIDALQYMAAMVGRSFRESEPGGGVERHPFALDPEALEESSTFVADMIIDGVRYTYGFAVDDVRIVEEWMYSYPHKRPREIFRRELDTFHYGDHSPHALRQAEQLTEPNVLFLSVAVRSKQRILLPVYEWFKQIEWRTTRDLVMPYIMEGWTSDDDSSLKRIVTLLRAADIGIEDAVVVEESEEEYVARMSRRRRSPAQKDTPRRKRLSFQHRGVDGGAALKMREQSTGTQSLYWLAQPAFKALDRGVPFIVDELDSSLHPFLTAQLIKLFSEPESNPHGAQLIFTSHDVSLLGRIQGEEVLKRDHIWFTEKDECGATELFPVSDFNPRRDENRERRYLAGRYGAVPVLRDELFAAALAAREEDSPDAPEES